MLHRYACRKGNFCTIRTTTKKAANVRKQLGMNNIKSNEGRQEKNGGVKGRDGSAEELNRETCEEQIIVGRTRRKHLLNDSVFIYFFFLGLSLLLY